MNFAHRTNLFSIFFKPFIHFLGNKCLVEKEKTKTEPFQFCSLGPAVKAARPTPARAQSRARLRTQAATWA